MTEVAEVVKNIPYYWVDDWKNGHWTPRRKMREAGFKNVACGPDGPLARAKALIWWNRWLDHKAGKTVDTEVWPAGSCGEAFQEYRRTGEWKRKEPRTREDWWRGWSHIKDTFGCEKPAEVTLQAMSLWYSGDPDDPNIKGLLDKVSVREAHRAVKIWRAMWQVFAAMKYCKADEDPSFGIRRMTPKGRTATWTEGEAVRLVKRGLRMKFYGAACIIAVAFDSQFQPVDCRKIEARHKREPDGRIIFDLSDEGRTKTDKPVIGTLSRRAERLIRWYLNKQFGDAELIPSAKLFLNRSGDAYTKDTLGDDFRDIRAAEFGAGETRKLMDMRRSGTVEAVAGEVDPTALSKKLGNTIDESRELQLTYAPTRTAIVRIADQARLVGRRRLRKGDT